jgi:hypothetical protein
MDVQDLRRQGGHLVGRHHPRADAEEQDELHGRRRQPHAPQGDGSHAPRDVEHHVDSILAQPRAVAREERLIRERREAGLHVPAELVFVVRQP